MSIIQKLRCGRFGAVTLVVLLTGCAESGPNGLLDASAIAPPADQTATLPQATPAQSLAEAMALEQQGDRKRAFAAVSLAYAAEPANPDIVVAYSRLALANGSAAEAGKAIDAAEAGGLKDWRILSAKGAVLAEQGDLKGAKSALKQGLELAPDQPALLNNLAFVYTLEGEPKMAEDLLRRASAAPDAKPRTRQNLALVLGLQGKYEESQKLAAAETSSEVASANVAYLKSLNGSKGDTKLAEAED